MPRFQFEAKDASGAHQSGVIDAATANDAILQLSQRGLRLESINSAASAPKSVRAAPQPVPTNRSRQAPVSQRRVAAARPAPSRPAARKTVSPKKPVVKTRPTSEREIFFLFTQLADMFRAGVSPFDAFSRLAARKPNTQLGNAYEDVASQARQGVALHEAMARYPSLFPPAVRGTVQAGATGGYLADACAQAATAAQANHRLVYWKWISLIVVASFLIGIPLLLSGMSVVDRAISSINDPAAAGDSSVVVAYMKDGFRRSFTGWSLAVWIVVLGGIVSWFIYNRTPGSRFFRHRLGAGLPVFGKRGRSEAVSHFAYHANRLMNSAVSPAEAVRLAAGAIPNEHIRAKMLRDVSGGESHTPASQILRRSCLVRPEYVDLLETGEFTGSAGQQLEELQKMSRIEAETAEKHGKLQLGCWLLIVSFGFTAVLTVLLYRTYLDSAFRHILE
ncbi:MAG: type II secretion system F family protein [Fimbriimonadaceae bacterium]